jgi:hypothetical protein
VGWTMINTSEDEARNARPLATKPCNVQHGLTFCVTMLRSYTKQQTTTELEHVARTGLIPQAGPCKAARLLGPTSDPLMPCTSNWWTFKQFFHVSHGIWT